MNTGKSDAGSDDLPAAEGRDQRLGADQLKVWHTFVDGGWALMAQVQAHFGAQGVVATDMRLLEIIAERESAGISELATAMHAGLSTVSRVVSRLLDEGLLDRVPSHVDARHRLVRITEAGRAELDRQLVLRDQVIRRCVVDALSEDEYRQIGDIFAKVRDACVEP
ncbi:MULTISPECIES: MarR family transcriptional regulator [Gordonia]|uniref:MarR family winged helix-turn-helix transcriptional regulator n=1 Tax=Gordonia TaxID=2053 RepID=UPI0002BE1C4D|nr:MULTISPECIES: MarR family transcriptional regulator [Gordonia]WLP92709.1 MarR family transcriptional regulator [Gordonia sp. NB41Y]